MGRLGEQPGEQVGVVSERRGVGRRQTRLVDDHHGGGGARPLHRLPEGVGRTVKVDEKIPSAISWRIMIPRGWTEHDDGAFAQGAWQRRRDDRFTIRACPAGEKHDGRRNADPCQRTAWLLHGTRSNDRRQGGDHAVASDDLLVGER